MLIPTELNPDERLDDLHRNNYKIIQNPDWFCFGMDAVLLSDFAKVHKNQKHVDLCSGTGIIPILLAAKSKGLSFCGVEIQPYMACMATRSIALNGLCDRVSMVCADLKEFGDLKAGSYDVVTANPPYEQIGSGKQSPKECIAIARHELACTLEDVVAAAFRLLVPQGRFYMVHRPHRLPDIFLALDKYGLAPKVLRLVQPKIGQPPNLLLISAVKGGGLFLKVEAPLIIYNQDGSYTKEVHGIYYD
jgi:tRNA1Val (adenine37-N6)-methyltransferase